MKNALIALSLAAACLAVAIWFAWFARDPRADDPEPAAARPQATDGSHASAVTPLGDLAPVEIAADEPADGIPTSEGAEIDLGAGANRIEGVVVSPTGAPAAGARVTLHESELGDLFERGGLDVRELFARGGFRGGFALGERWLGALPAEARVIAGADGRFVFLGVPAGDHIASAVTPGTVVTAAERPVRVTADERDSAHQLVDLLPEGRVQGTVVDPAGVPVSGTELHARGVLFDFQDMRRAGGAALTAAQVCLLVLNPLERRATTGADGAFSLGGLALAEADVRALPPEPWAERSLRVQTDGGAALEIVLELGVTLSGRVVDGRGEGLADVEVRCRAAPDFGRGGMRSFLRTIEGRTARTDEVGAFRFAGLAAGSFRLTAEAEGYREGVVPEVRVAAGETGYVEIPLEVGAIIAGRVLGPGGAGIAGATVEARARRGDPGGGRRGRRGRPQRVESDGEGRFRFDTLSDGEYTLTVRHPGYSTAQFDASTGEDRLRLELAPGAELSGRLVTPDGDPIPGARVSLAGGWRASDRTTTDDAGQFALSGLEPGTVTVSLRASGFVEEEVEVETGEVGDLVLQMSPVIVGWVRAPDGTSAAGARVSAVLQRSPSDPAQRSARRRDGGAPADRGARGARRGRGRGADGARFGRRMGRGGRASTWADDEGRFRLELPRDGGRWNVTASARGYLDGTSEGIAPDGPEIRIDLGRAGTLVGRVSSAGGQPVQGASIRLREVSEDAGSDGGSPRRGRGRRGGRFGGGRTAESDLEGGYRVEGIAPGLHRLEVDARGFAPFAGAEIAITPGGTERFDVELIPESRMRGVVVGPDGRPLSGAGVRVRGASGTFRMGRSDLEGRFEIGGLAAEALRVDVQLRGYVPWQGRDLLPDGPDVTVVLDVAHTIRGVVYDAVSGEPVARATVRAEQEGGEVAAPRRAGWRGFRELARSRADGSFEIGDLAPGNWSISVTAADYVAAVTEPFSLPGSRAEAIEISLVPGARLSGRVLDPGGDPVAAAVVTAERVSEESPPSAADESIEGRGGSRGARPGRAPRAVTDDRGEFVVTGLEEGVYELVIRHDEFLTARVPDLEARVGGGAPPLTQVLEVGAELSGRLVGPGGLPVAGGRIALRGGSPRETRRASPDDDGRYRIAGLAPGEYQLTYTQGRSRTPIITRTVALRAGQRRQLQLRLD